MQIMYYKIALKKKEKDRFLINTVTLLCNEEKFLLRELIRRLSS